MALRQSVLIGGGWTARNEQIADVNLHLLAVLIERRRTHLDQAPIGLRFGRTHFEHFGFRVKVIAGPNWARPAQLIDTNSQDTVGRPELAVDKQTHGQRRGMPAARRQSAENRFAGGFVVQMVRLRIKLPGERNDLILVYS